MEQVMTNQYFRVLRYPEPAYLGYTGILRGRKGNSVELGLARWCEEKEIGRLPLPEYGELPRDGAGFAYMAKMAAFRRLVREYFPAPWKTEVRYEHTRDGWYGVLFSVPGEIVLTVPAGDVAPLRVPENPFRQPEEETAKPGKRPGGLKPGHYVRVWEDGGFLAGFHGLLTETDGLRGQLQVLCQPPRPTELLRIQENHPLLEGAGLPPTLPPGTTCDTTIRSDLAGRRWKVYCTRTELLSPRMSLSRLEPIDAGLPVERKAPGK